MEQQLVRLVQQNDLLTLQLTIVIVLHILEIAFVGFLAAWSVKIVRDDNQRIEENNRRIEREWTQVLQILAHGRTAEHERA